MNITGFLQCMSGNSFQTGNLLAYYDFSQKDSNVVFNQLYPTGSAYTYIPTVYTLSSPSITQFYEDPSHPLILENSYIYQFTVYAYKTNTPFGTLYSTGTQTFSLQDSGLGLSSAIRIKWSSITGASGYRIIEDSVSNYYAGRYRFDITSSQATTDVYIDETSLMVYDGITSALLTTAVDININYVPAPISPQTIYTQLINIDTVPGIFVGTTPNISNQFSTKVGSYLNLQNLHTLFNFDFSGCQNTGQTQATILLSSKKDRYDISGFNFGINSSNRLFFENGSDIYTLNKELRNKNIANLSIASNQFVNFGLFDFENNTYNGLTVQSSLRKSLSDLYLIYHLSGAGSYHSGLLGTLNNFALLNDSISQKDILSNCLFCTGANYTSGAVSGFVIDITGITTQNTYQSGITGYQQVSFTGLKENGSVYTGYYSSGVSGFILTDSQLIAQTSSGAYSTFSYSIPSLVYNTGEKLSYANYDVLFNAGQNTSALYSGDKIEIYTYSGYQPYKNIEIIDLTLPSSNLNLNLYINGLLETQGVDYLISSNQISIINNYSTINNIVANYSNKPTVTIDYTGIGQFPINSSGQVCITGSGFTTGYDPYLNGQKLIKNIDFYNTGTYLSQPAVIFSSGNLITGSEIKFYPLDDVPLIKLIQLTGSANIISGITGFSEQIWVNGLLQYKYQDYVLSQNCFQDNYYFLSSISDLLVYNNNNYYLNN